MQIEDNVFKRYSPNFERLVKFGFVKDCEGFVFEKLFKDNLFKAVIKIDFEGNILGKVMDIENDDEFLPLRVEDQKGAFVGEVRSEYEKILESIRNECFVRNYFVCPQSNRITNLIIERYGNKPEFLWEKYDDTGIFRNPESQKLYAIIMEVYRSKIQKGKKGFIEVMNVKLAPEHIENLLRQEHFYPAYHMNKKYWISIILDETVIDKKIMELVEESHSYTVKKVLNK